MNDLTPRHCKTCTCTIGAVEANQSHLRFHPPTNAAAGVPNIQIFDVTAAAAPLVLPTRLHSGAAGAVPPMIFERITVR